MATRLPFIEFQEIYSKVPRLCLDLVVKNHQGVLLTLRNIEPAKGFWHIPGGTLLYDESIEQAIQRIALDELGTGVVVKRLLGFIDWFGTKQGLGRPVSLEFLVEPTGQIKIGSQASKFRFFKQIPVKTIKEHANFLQLD